MVNSANTLTRRCISYDLLPQNARQYQGNLTAMQTWSLQAQGENPLDVANTWPEWLHVKCVGFPKVKKLVHIFIREFLETTQRILHLFN